MAETIDYFFTHVSPYAYLGHAAFMDMAARHGVTVRFRPVNLGSVFPQTGGLPLGQRHPARQTYRWYELQRWQHKRDVPMKFKPAHFPTDPALADCAAIAIAEAGRSPDGFCRRMFAACWSEDRDIADADVVAAALGDCGEEAAAIIDAARSDPVRARYADNAEAAVAIPAVGSPCYVRQGEPFWGQDRIELLEDAIASAREPFRPL